MDGKIHDLGGLPRAFRSGAAGINSHNKVCGTSEADSFLDYAWVWTKKSGIVALPLLYHDGLSRATGINDFGVLVGIAQTSSGAWHAVLWNASGMIRDLGTLGGDVAGAFGVNDLTQIVGQSTTSSNVDHAFLWTKEEGMRDLNDLIPARSGWELRSAIAINGSGQITGRGTINGETHAYCLTPKN